MRRDTPPPPATGYIGLHATPLADGALPRGGAFRTEGRFIMKGLRLSLAAVAALGFAMAAAGEASARPGGHGWRGHHGHHFARHPWRHHHWGWRRPAIGFYAAPVYAGLACEWARVRTPYGPRWRRVCL